MKKYLIIFIMIASVIVFSACTSANSPSETTNNDDNTTTNSETQNNGQLSLISSDTDAITTNQTVDSKTGVTVIDGAKITNTWNLATIDLSSYQDQQVTIDFTCTMKVVSSDSSDTTLLWQVNDSDASYPTVASGTFTSGEWKTITGTLSSYTVGKSKVIYLSSYGLTKENLVITISYLKVTITANWLSATSLKDTYANYFDKFGIAITYDELKTTAVQSGLARHASSITMGNEFKPDFIFNWVTPNTSGSFTGSNGKAIAVPTNTPNWTKPDAILQICKDKGLTMRGHVLVWHSQTPDWFFHKDFNTSEDYVDTDTMNARMEWYIKTVLTHVTEWENTNNSGKHIIYTWDVVNEATSDSATDTKWLRGSNGETSNWYSVYKDDSFIINAFRYANKYAPSDVLLAYNDYNTYIGSSNATGTGGKTNAILKLIDAVQACESDATLPTRLDVMGMQSHVGISYPNVTGTDSYETAVKKFIAKGLYVQVTEIDIANGTTTYNDATLKAKYKEYFTMFLNNRKTTSSKGISGVTIWGINDGSTWLNALTQYNGYTQYPLLFNDDYTCKPAFYGVIEAATEYTSKD